MNRTHQYTFAKKCTKFFLRYPSIIVSKFRTYEGRSHATDFNYVVLITR